MPNPSPSPPERPSPSRLPRVSSVEPVQRPGLCRRHQWTTLHLFPGSTSEEIQRCICELSSRSQVAYKMLNASSNSSNQAENNLLEWFKFMEQLKMALKIGIGPNYATLGLEVANQSNTCE